jgi:histidine triad (HIT) family protein
MTTDRPVLIGSDEAERRKAAIDAVLARGATDTTAKNMHTTDPDCIFCKIVRGEIPCRKVYEDADVLAFHDIRPIAPVHFMLVPKRHVATLYDATLDDAPVLGRMLALSGKLAQEQGAADGFRTIINTGRVGQQEVQHVHIHVIAGPEPLGPMMRRTKQA